MQLFATVLFLAVFIPLAILLWGYIGIIAYRYLKGRNGNGATPPAQKEQK